MTLRDVLDRQRRLFGKSHPAIADTLSYIGQCYLDQELHTEARAMFVECYNIRKEFFTVDQVHIAESMVDIVRARQGQPERVDYPRASRGPGQRGVVVNLEGEA